MDVRVIATSNRDLPKSVSKGEFRQGLFFRLNVVPIAVPPLRSRPGDVTLLAEHFLRRMEDETGRTGLRMSSSVSWRKPTC